MNPSASMVLPVCIIGGGLAGLTSAILLALKGHSVHVVEPYKYPRHKVCGEYLSAEAVRVFEKQLGIRLEDLGGKPLDRLWVTNAAGKEWKTALPLGGIGISRFTLDYAMYQRAVSLGVTFHFDKVTDIHNDHSGYTLQLQKNTSLLASFVIGAFGKQSVLEKVMDREVPLADKGWIGGKAHFDSDEISKGEVGLHHFTGGYAGISETESGSVNLCFLMRLRDIKKDKKESFYFDILKENPVLRNFLDRSKCLFPQPLYISRFTFVPRPLYWKGIPLVGDAGALIHPLCGNGMAIAIHSAVLAVKALEEVCNHRIKPEFFTKHYEYSWKQTFSRRFYTGNLLQKALMNHTSHRMLFPFLQAFPKFGKKMIQRTHGTEIPCG